MTAEPSMEDILSSIKRIIAEEGDAAPARPRRQARTAPPASEPLDDDAEEVLELNDPVPPPAMSTPTPQPAEPASPPKAAEPIVSAQTVAATRGSLEALSRLMVKPEPTSDGTLEGLVREMLRPMLRDWFDANLPAMVEAMVAQEIAKITGRPG